MIALFRLLFILYSPFLLFVAHLLLDCITIPFLACFNCDSISSIPGVSARR